MSCVQRRTEFRTRTSDIRLIAHTFGRSFQKTLYLDTPDLVTAVVGRHGFSIVEDPADGLPAVELAKARRERWRRDRGAWQAHIEDTMGALRISRIHLVC